MTNKAFFFFYEFMLEKLKKIGAVEMNNNINEKKIRWEKEHKINNISI